ncbi:putative NRPS-like enzyme [Colletotrichum eremochloae]|nr:putative NRPS-like enzyme [Colletotrichum eremochloae]
MSSFKLPEVSLQPTSASGPRTLPELVDFHAENNAKHLFCLQAENTEDGKGHHFVSLDYETLQLAIARCQTWLGEQTTSLHLPETGPAGRVNKCPPVAVLMESHIGLVICVLACMGMGVPVVLLSARLSVASARHLIRATGARLALVSPRLLPLASEALGVEKQHGKEMEGAMAVIRIVSGYESFLMPGQHARSLGDTIRTAYPNHFVSEEDRQVVILHSSGTSGLPKPIPCSHKYFLSYATCHSFESTAEAHGLTVSTLPFFHGFGFVSVCLYLNIGKTVCVPPPSTIPNGASIAALIENSQARALLTVPSILEEIEGLPEGRGLDVLRGLDFVGFGGGRPKASVGDKLARAGVKLIGQYGATETGPMTPFFIPGKGHDWRHLRLRSDILRPLEVKLDLVNEIPRSQPELNPAQTSYTYKLSMIPFGWQKRFELQDMIVARTECVSDEDVGRLDFVISGRHDDLICLATGEKVRPTVLESLLRQQEDVRDATAFGEGQFELGVIIEPIRFIGPSEMQNSKASVWPAVEEASRQMDAHAKIVSPVAIFVVSPGALPRSDKGTVLRSAVAEKFSEEIATVYRDLEANIVAPPIDLFAPDSSIRDLVVRDVMGQNQAREWQDEDDFFARGMDSLQATRLRRLLTASLRATHAAAAAAGLDSANILPTDEVMDDLVYRNPSIEKLVQAIIPSHSNSDGAMSDTRLIGHVVDKFSGGVDCEHQRRAVVVITGSTGSLGSFLVGRLLGDEKVGSVVCLNRPGREDPLETQKRALRSRKISVDNGTWAKLEVHQTNTSEERLGLPESEYERLAARVTHVVHIAWPMNFKMRLQSFGTSFASLRNLLRLACNARPHLGLQKPRVLLISSISTVGNYPSMEGQAVVPEISVRDHSWALDLGYAKAKLVCEKLIERAAEDYPEIEPAVVRIGQLAGSSNGYWNAAEHFVAICASSQRLGKFPDLRGTLSWLPVDSAAEALAEILLHQDPLHPVYHLENPARQSWEEVTRLISEELQISSSSIVQLDHWLNLVEAFPKPNNPAAGLIHFLRNDFSKMSCGYVILDTSVSRSASSTMASMKPIKESIIRGYVSYWRRIKLLA